MTVILREELKIDADGPFCSRCEFADYDNGGCLHFCTELDEDKERNFLRCESCLAAERKLIAKLFANDDEQLTCLVCHLSHCDHYFVTRGGGNTVTIGVHERCLPSEDRI